MCDYEMKLLLSMSFHLMLNLKNQFRLLHDKRVGKLGAKEKKNQYLFGEKWAKGHEGKGKCSICMDYFGLNLVVPFWVGEQVWSMEHEVLKFVGCFL